MEKIIDSESGKVCFQEEKNGENIAILSHGYLSDKNSRTNLELAKRLKEEGISTLRFDMYGHGESEGDVKHLTIGKVVANLKAVYGYAQKRYQKIGLVGSSFTGSVVLIVAEEKKPEAICLKCPVFDYVELTKERMGLDGIEKWKKEKYTYPFGKPLAFDVYEEAKNYNMGEIAEKIKCPAMIIHGTNDRTIDIKHSRKLYSILKCKKEFVAVEGADHFFKPKKDFEIMIEKSFRWLKNHLK